MAFTGAPCLTETGLPARNRASGTGTAGAWALNCFSLQMNSEETCQ